MYRPTMSRTFSTKAGSEESLKVSTRCGRKPKARQMRLTAVWLMPARRAIARVLQCVAFRGASSSVRATRRSTASSPMLRGAPERGASASPSNRCSAKRPRQVATVCRLKPSAAATPRLVAPGSAQASTARMRWASACPTPRRRSRRCSSPRSASLRTVADDFRANSGLMPSEYAAPVLGLLFLRQAETRFAEVAKQLGGGRGRRSEPSTDDFKANGALYLPEEARFSRLLALPGAEDFGKAINAGMAAIEKANTELEAALPRSYGQ